MTSIRNPRLRLPLLLMANGDAVAAAVLTIPVTAGWYAWSGRDSD